MNELYYLNSKTRGTKIHLKTKIQQNTEDLEKQINDQTAVINQYKYSDIIGCEAKNITNNSLTSSNNT